MKTEIKMFKFRENGNVGRLQFRKEVFLEKWHSMINTPFRKSVIQEMGCLGKLISKGVGVRG